MSANDYIFVESMLGNTYLAKQSKSPMLMSKDRRIVTDNEIIGLFEHYLKRWCKENKSDTLVITTTDGKEIFRAILKETEK